MCQYTSGKPKWAGAQAEAQAAYLRKVQGAEQSCRVRMIHIPRAHHPAELYCLHAACPSSILDASHLDVSLVSLLTLVTREHLHG